MEIKGWRRWNEGKDICRIGWKGGMETMTKDDNRMEVEAKRGEG